MKYVIEIHPKLEEDLGNAAVWYDEQAPGLGERLISAFEKSIEIIIRQPFAFPVCFDYFRQVKVDTFPYVIVYEIAGNRILIQKFIHTSRDPNERVKKR